MANKNHFFTEAGQQEIIAAIKEAEHNTSGEIKVHVERRCKGRALDRASKVFELLKMHKTDQRNGVLFYLATDDRQFAILGDAGINAKVPENFWNDIKETVIKHFKNENFAGGLAAGILMAGEKLKTHFPHHKYDVNEIEDGISFGKD